MEKSAVSITGTRSTDRGTCWSLTINNPTDTDTGVSLPGGWCLKGQYEKGEQGTLHFQGMLTTNQCRMSAVKAVFPRAHIELAKNRKALEAYVSKDDTRVAAFETRHSAIPTLWDYQRDVADRWDWSEFQKLDDFWFTNDRRNYDQGTVVMAYVDKLVGADIEGGAYGIEFISVNPLWISSWKKHWRDIISRSDKARLNQQFNNLPD